MNAQEIFEHQLVIMLAIKEGKKVESRNKGMYNASWKAYQGVGTGFQCLNFTDFEFRIAPPEPLRQEFWFKNSANDLKHYVILRDAPSPEVIANWAKAGWRRVTMVEEVKS